MIEHAGGGSPPAAQAGSPPPSPHGGSHRQVREKIFWNALPAWLPLALITALGAALRLYGLDKQSLGNDELSSWTQYSFSWWDVVSHRMDPLHPPGYRAVMYLWVSLCGDSEAMLRLPSALAGIAAIPAMYALGKRLYGPSEGLIAAAITATAWTPLFFSQEGRAYSFLFLWTVLSSYWLIDIVRALRQRRALPTAALVGYVLAAELACYFHYFGVFFTGLQAVLVGLLFLRSPAALLSMAAIYGIIGLAYLPWLYRAYADLPPGPSWLLPPTPADVPRFIRSLFSGSNVIGALVVALWATLLRTTSRQRSFGAVIRSADALLFLWLLAPLAIAYVWSHLAAAVFYHRYLIIVAPAAYLLLARAVTQLPLRRTARAVVAALLPAVLLFQLVVVEEYFTRPNKAQFRDAVAYLIRRDTNTDTLIFATAWNRAFFNYYFERLGSVRRVDRLAETADDRAMIASLIETRGPDSVWLLAGHKRPTRELLDWLTEELQLVGEAHFLGADAWHFAPRRPARAARSHADLSG